MKYRLLICLLLAVLILSGCAEQKDSDGAETTVATEMISSELFSGVDDVYTDVLRNSSGPGYSLMDLDGNGHDELLITDGKQIYEMYAICDDGKLHKKVEIADNIVEIYLCSDNRIYVHESHPNGGEHYYLLTMRTRVDNLPQELCVITDGSKWWAGPYEKDAQLTSESEAKDLLDAIAFQEIAYIPIS